MTGLSSQPLPMTTEKQATGCTKPLVSILLSGYSYMMSHHSRCKHRPWHVHLLPSAMRTVSVTAWIMANRQLSFLEWWWGFMVYVSAVGSQLVSGLAELSSLLYITCVGQLWGVRLKSVIYWLRGCLKHFLKHMNFWKKVIKRYWKKVDPCSLYTQSNFSPSVINKARFGRFWIQTRQSSLCYFGRKYRPREPRNSLVNIK